MLLAAHQLHLRQARRGSPAANLIPVQKESFDWFIRTGLGETLKEISPVEDFTGNLALQFLSHDSQRNPSSTRTGCKEKDMTFSLPLIVTCAFINKSARGPLGDAPFFTGPCDSGA